MILEVAVDDPLCLSAAVAGGADRIELCSALALGGLTPSIGLMRHAAGCGLPIMAMIRPRPGGFCLDDTDLAIMLADIAAARQAGLAGVVFGALTPELTLDMPKMDQLCAAADGMQITLHRAFDLIEDWRRALEQAVALGVHRILTSGAALSAPAGITRLAEIVDYAAGRIGILPGAGISAETAGTLRNLKIEELHASCGAPVMGDAKSIAFGFASPNARRTDAGKVRALKAVMTGH